MPILTITLQDPTALLSDVVLVPFSGAYEQTFDPVTVETSEFTAYGNLALKGPFYGAKVLLVVGLILRDSEIAPLDAMIERQEAIAQKCLTVVNQLELGTTTRSMRAVKTAPPVLVGAYDGIERYWAVQLRITEV